MSIVTIKFDSAKVRQTGFVSIIVAAMLMVILSLITLGFTRLMQREQRQALDRQLSRQALYAAESGINDVVEQIRSGIYTGMKEKTDCLVAGLGPHGNGNLSGPADDTIAYTCAIFDQTPGSLEYDISANRSKITQLENSSGANFTGLTVSWGYDGADAAGNDVSGLPNCGNPANILPATRPNNIPVLRLDLTSTSTASPYARDDLLRDTDYLYLVPCGGGGTNDYDYLSGDRGNLIQVQCNGTGQRPCEINIQGLDASSAGGSDRYFARMRPVYANASVAISGQDASGTAQFANAQIGVDVTAKAGDVVRRLRVNVPFSTESSPVPEAALHAFDGVCKQLEILSSTVPGANIVDSCSSFPPPPQPPPPTGSCPTPAGNQTTTSFNLSRIAWASSNSPLSIDVLYDYNTTDPARIDLKWTDPDLDLAELDSKPALRVAEGCQYRVDYTVFCGAPQGDDNFRDGKAPKLYICNEGQRNEGFRTNFYSDYALNSTTQCDRGTKLAHFDVPDHFVGAVSEAYYEGMETVVVNGPVTGTVSIRCMEMVAGCEVDVNHVGCNIQTITGGSSIYMHSFKWIEEPI